jgi:hypothetical protein
MKRIADELKEKNIAEYLIYMWQVEDLIRANNCDMGMMDKNVVSKFDVDDAEKKEIFGWYENLTEMMTREGVKEKGHLQINKNLLMELSELHVNLLSSTKFPYYQASYYKALPFIVELRAKSKDNDVSEIETCFDGLYGILLMRLQKKEITQQTANAMTAISSFISMLANFYDKDRKNELDW